MNTDAPRRPAALRQVTLTGSALATALLPLVVGVLAAKALAADPLTPVNALITTGAHRPRITPAHWRTCGRSALGRVRGSGRALRRYTGSCTVSQSRTGFSRSHSTTCRACPSGGKTG
ncbi:hypothetical protein ACIQUQ_27230 [Streptomyces sp. NPDC101118]|uniref:hypothetical protein n=1 Tax=unclassified Streptomyces TaxID=2593676 RepID=UPI0037D8544A